MVNRKVFVDTSEVLQCLLQDLFLRLFFATLDKQENERGGKCEVTVCPDIKCVIFSRSLIEDDLQRRLIIGLVEEAVVRTLSLFVSCVSLSLKPLEVSKLRPLRL